MILRTLRRLVYLGKIYHNFEIIIFHIWNSDCSSKSTSKTLRRVFSIDPKNCWVWGDQKVMTLFSRSSSFSVIIMVIELNIRWVAETWLQSPSPWNNHERTALLIRVRRAAEAVPSVGIGWTINSPQADQPIPIKWATEVCEHYTKDQEHEELWGSILMRSFVTLSVLELD